MSLYIDLTEFLVNPITTGIQRIIGEICKYTPHELLLLPSVLIRTAIEHCLISH